MYISNYLPQYLFENMMNKPHAKDGYEMSSDDHYVLNQNNKLVKLKDEFKTIDKNEVSFRTAGEALKKTPCPCSAKK